MRYWFFILLLATMPLHQAHAAAGEWQRDNDVVVRLISGVDGVGSEKQIPLGLEVKLASGWHTYWRSPGEAGLPPQIDWSDSLTDQGNLENARLLYPAPQRYTAYGMETIGYREHVIFPIEAILKTPGQQLVINAKLNLLVCSDICVPKNFKLGLTVPVGELKAGAETKLVDEAYQQLPATSAVSSFKITSVQRNSDNLQITAVNPTPFNTPDIFVENDKGVTFAKPVVVLDDLQTTAAFTLNLADKLPDNISLAELPVTVTITNSGARAMEETLTPDVAVNNVPADPPIIAPISPTHSLGFIVLLALLGGFILNLMPCVLPVLSLKILGVISHGGGTATTVRRSFYTTASGIIFSFIVLAAVTATLKEAGHAIGWGVQFQQPVFLVLLIILLVFFASNLWGLFEIPLPRFLADRFDPLYHPKLAGDFATGAFATLLATPCTAPFLGTAVGFALASGVIEIFIIFAALGLGMAIPYLAIAFWPRIATMLPRPGVWMVKLRYMLGWALAITALWLGWVLLAEIPMLHVIAITGVIILLLLSLYFLRYKKFRRISNYVIGLLLLLAFTLASNADAPTSSISIDKAWQPFDEQKISHHVSEGKTVFVDVTADWCLTCKANKKFTLASNEVNACLFANPQIIPMQADWTNPNPIITAFLQKYGRYGIPFNAVFGPGAPQGLVLPELLTPSMVCNGLAKAREKTQ